MRASPQLENAWQLAGHPRPRLGRNNLDQPQRSQSDSTAPLHAHAHAQNELLAANARIKQLEERLEGMREAGDAIWYCVRHAKRVDPAELIEAIEDWQEARNHG